MSPASVHVLPASGLDREAKLPRWAQSEIHRLRRELAIAEAEAQRATSGSREGAAAFVNYFSGSNAIGVAHPQERVLFSLTGPDTRMDTFQVSIDRSGTLEVMGGRGILLRPQASNVVQIVTANR